MPRLILPRTFALMTLLIGLYTLVPAQDEPLYDALTKTFKTKYLNVGILFQAVGDFQSERSFPGKNGFNVSNMRLNISGELDHGFGYAFKTNFINSPAILDAKAYYASSPQLIFDIGLFKPPFSKEYLTGAGGIDFVNRALAVTALAGSRQLGVQVRGASDDKLVSYGIGMFNGNGFGGNNNDNNDFMYVGRIAIMPKLSRSDSKTDEMEFGLSLGHSDDKNATIGGGILPSFDGQRTLFGGDVRWSHQRVTLSAEAIGAHLQHRLGGTNNPNGYHLTAGYMITDNSQLLARWESFMPDGLAADSKLLIFGYNLWPTSVTELQLNYIIRTTDSELKHHQVLVNAQFAF